MVWVESFTRDSTQFTPNDMNFDEDSEGDDLEYSNDDDENMEEAPVPQIVLNNDFFLLNSIGTPLTIGESFIKACSHVFYRFGLGTWRKVMETGLKEAGVNTADRDEMCDGMFHETATRDRYYVLPDESARSSNQARLYNRFRQTRKSIHCLNIRN